MSRAAPDVSGRSLTALLSLAGRAAVVTGGAQGIGEAIARRLAEAGARVLIADVDLGGAERVAAEIGGLARAVDVRDAAAVAAGAEACVERFGGLDIWINNAAVFPSGDLLSIPEDEWDDVLTVNLRGSWLGAREAARQMGERDEVQGVIVNIEAMAGYRGRLSGSHYVASKHGLVGLTRSLAAELGPRGIRVVGVAPTMTETPGVARRRERAVTDGQDTAGEVGRDAAGEVRFDAARPLLLERSLRSTAPLGRNAVPDDVARVVAFACSDLAVLVTGSTLFVDAGVLAP
jgi:NAD(P)-dependent dehydrogenase (short-subunit alcohol dehydrogenase family)